jgi:hypothetical protein
MCDVRLGEVMAAVFEDGGELLECHCVAARVLDSFLIQVLDSLDELRSNVSGFVHGCFLGNNTMLWIEGSLTGGAGATGGWKEKGEAPIV